MTGAPAVRIDATSAVPPFEQVRQQIADLIHSGVLIEGQRLPPVRQLASDLGLANGTVARAYQELETAGLVITKRAAGTRVAPAAMLSPDARADALTRQAHEYLHAGRRLGASDAELTAALTAALKAEASATRTNATPTSRPQ